MRKSKPVTRLDIKAPISVGSSTIDTADSPAPPAYSSVPPPDTIVLSTSIVYSSGTPLARISASWNAPPAADPAITSYYVQFSTSSSFVDSQTSTYPAPTNSLAIDVFKPLTTYYVRVATRVNGVLSDWSQSANIVTAADLSAPGLPTSVTAAFVNAGDLLITWTNPTDANFRDVEIKIYESSSKVTLYWTSYSATERFVFTAALNGQATSYVYDPSLYVELRSRSWGGIFSGVVSASATKAVPATPTSISHSWSGDTGTAGADWTISWAAAADAAVYRLSINGLTARIIGGTRYTYTLSTNISDNTSADPTLSYSLVAVDALGQASTAATGTATNAAPPTPTVTLTAGFSLLVAVIGGTKAADFDGYEYVFKLGGVAQRTLVSAASEQQYEVTSDGSGSWTVEVRQRDAFGQYSSVVASSAVVVDALTIGYLRALAKYTDDLGTASATLDALKDGNLASGGVTYSA